MLPALFVTVIIWVRSLEKMTYQAVICNAANALVTNQSIAMRVSILQGSASGLAFIRKYK